MQKEYRVYFSGRNYDAEGIYNIKDNSLKVLKGSIVVEKETNSMKAYHTQIANLREDLIKREIIVDNKFVQDYIFAMPYHASLVISTYGISGNKAWKTKDGKDIDELITINKNIDRFKDYYKDFKLDVDINVISSTIEKFNNKFPLSELKDLKIERYDKKGSKNTFMYALEHGTNEIASGFLGTNKNKIIYNIEDDKYEAIQYLKNKYPKLNINELYKLYIDSLYKFIVEFDKENYISGDIEALPSGTNIIRSKALMLYRPKEILKISSMKVFKDIFKYFGLNSSNMDSIMMNIEIQDFLEDLVDDADNIKLSRALWRFYEDIIKEEKETDNKEINDFQDLFLENEFINEIVRILKRKKAIILKGVPGVGKTFIIKDIIKNSFDNIEEKSIQMIQFHQSYSYEEFVEGLRPQMSGGYDIEKGIFYDISTLARENPESNYFLIIDEINRGNMSKIFGELLMLVEKDKRDDYFVKLTYSKEEFTIPSNLYIIGTMNTADRSLALVDYAMRRRFSFITLNPAYNTPKFNRFLSEKMSLDKSMINIINRRMIKVNQIIKERLDKDFIIGHSYFIEDKDDIIDSKLWFDEVIKYDIMPMIEEYFFDDEDTIDEIKDILYGKYE